MQHKMNKYSLSAIFTGLFVVLVFLLFLLQKLKFLCTRSVVGGGQKWLVEEVGGPQMAVK